MSPLELTTLITALVFILLVFVAGDRRHNAGRLSVPMILFLRIFLGIIFAILGVIGSILPIMQGWIFFLLAALVLFPQSRFAIKACHKIEPRMPRLIAWLRRMGIGVPRETRDTMPAE